MGLYATAYRGNDVTSCQFAEAVRTAYVQVLESGGGTTAASGDGVTITAKDPVADKSYEMTCRNTEPVLCEGADNTSVYIAPFVE